MKIPLVSVVIPAYNAADTVGECIESVLAQCYPAIEIVLIDDGSTDDTAEVVKRFGSSIRYVWQANGGLASARNTGHRLASGEFIAWLDADDLCEPDRIALQAEYLLMNDSVGLVSSEFSGFNEEGLIAERYSTLYYGTFSRLPLNAIFPFCEQYHTNSEWLSVRPQTSPVYRGRIYETLVWGNFIHPPTVMFRRELVNEVGPLDPTLPNSEDWEFFIRVSRITDCAHLDTPLLRYRRHPKQLSDLKNMRKHILVWIEVQKKIQLQDPVLAERNRDRARRQLGEWHSHLALEAAERDRRLSLPHMLQAVALGPEYRVLLKAFLHFVLPRTAVSAIRRILGALARLQFHQGGR